VLEDVLLPDTAKNTSEPFVEAAVPNPIAIDDVVNAAVAEAAEKICAVVATVPVISH
jgi:hypothetical protein